MDDPLLQEMTTLRSVGVEHINNKKYKEASTYFRDILAKFQKAIPSITSEELMERAIKEIKMPAHKNLALCYLKLSDWKACSTECKTVLEIQPNNVKILYRIGTALKNAKKLQQSQQYLRRAFMLDPHETEIMKALQDVQMDRNMLQAKRSEKEEQERKQKSIFGKAMAILMWALMLGLGLLNYVLSLVGLSISRTQSKSSKQT